MYAFIVSERYNTSGLDYARFLSAVGTPSLIEDQGAAATTYHVNGVAGFYVPLPAGSCVKFDASLGLGLGQGQAIADLGIQISEMAV